MGIDCNPLVNRNGIEKNYRLTASIVRSIRLFDCFSQRDTVFPLSRCTCCI